MSGFRASKGCLPCRTRRVKCDEARPSCSRCVKRNDTCTGYREPGTTFAWRDENEKAAYLSNSRVKRSVRERVEDIERGNEKSSTSQSCPSTSNTGSVPDKDHEISLQGLKLGGNSTPWLRGASGLGSRSVEERAVEGFFKDYVLYPCTSTSTPGFLEQLPCLFEEVGMVQVEGRSALRWAVRAVSLASLAAKLPSKSLLSGEERGKVKREIRFKADIAFGEALQCLASCLGSEKEEEKISDYTLMTIVVLDLFEALFQPDVDNYGAHTQGMAHIMRTRGPDQLVTPRGWSLFRVSQHRLQRQQLAFPADKAPSQSGEVEAMLGLLDEDVPEISLERTNFEISKICARARELRGQLASAIPSDSPRTSEHQTQEIIDLVREMHDLDTKAAAWRTGDNWTYQTVPTTTLRYPDKGKGLSKEELTKWPQTTGLYPDLWIAYECNYHRTARLLMHVQILKCLDALPHKAENLVQHSLATINTLTGEILASVPQHLGDVTNTGFLLNPSPSSASASALLNNGEEGDVEGGNGGGDVSAVGAYFLLWPVKVLEGCAVIGEEQREMGRRAFERVRGVTGMIGRVGAVEGSGV